MKNAGGTTSVEIYQRGLDKMIGEAGGRAGASQGQPWSGNWAGDRASQLPLLLRQEKRRPFDKLGRRSWRGRGVWAAGESTEARGGGKN